MRPVTVALLLAGVAGAGGAVWYFVIRPRRAAAIAAATPTNGVAVVSAKTPSVGGVNVGAVLSGDHVTRKNALAPAVLGQFGIPTGVSQPITNLAGKLDVSSYAERYITSKVPIVGTIAEAPINLTKAVSTKVVSGVSSLGHSIASLF